MKLGKLIQTLRKEQGITQKELANELGVSVQAVSKWENGGTPDITLIPRIAHFLDIGIGTLFGEGENELFNLPDRVFDTLVRLNPEERVNLSRQLIWTVFKAASGYTLVKNKPLTDSPPFGKDSSCTRCFLDYDQMLAASCATEEFQYFYFLYEPLEGSFEKILLPTERYAEIFSKLSDKVLLDILLFAANKSGTPFSARHVACELHLQESAVEQKLSVLTSLSLLSTIHVDLDDGRTFLYKYDPHNIMLLPTLLAVRELVEPASNWTLSNAERTHPLLAPTQAQRKSQK